MATLSSNSSAPTELQRRNALRVSVVRTFGAAALLLFLYSVLYPTETQGESLSLVLSWTLFVGNFVGLLLVRAGRTVGGLVVSIMGLHLTLFGFGLVFAGLGPVILFAIVGLTAISVANTLPQNISRQALLAATIFGLIALLVDLYVGVTEFRPLPPTYTEVLRFAWLLTLVLFAVNLLHLRRQFRYFSLRTKLITSFVAVTLIALGLLGGINNYFTRETLTREANEALFAAASQTEDSLQDFLNSNRASITNEARLPAMLELLLLQPGEEATQIQRARVYATLRALTDKEPLYIVAYSILDMEGNVVVDSNSPNPVGNYATEVAFLNARAGEAYVSPVRITGMTDEPSLYFSAPIRTNFDQTIGVLLVEYRANILQDLLARSNDLVGPDSFAVLFDEHLIHLAHGAAPETIFTAITPMDAGTLAALRLEGRLPNRPTSEIVNDLPDLARELTLAAASPTAHYFTAVDIATGDRQLQAVAIRMPDTNWTLALFQPQDTFLAPAEAQGRTTLLLALVVAAAVVAIAIGLAQILTAPIASLTLTARTVAEGNLAARAEVETNDEIGLLANTFNTMTSRLGELVTGLEQQVSERTRDLQHRAEMLQTTAEIARDATLEPQLQDMLNRAVDLVAQRFGLYHAAIYLNRPSEQATILMAGSGEIGEQLLEGEHRLRIGSETNVGYVTLIGEARLARENDSNFRIARHPLLPATQSQLVVPLRVADQIIGALDLQSERLDGFREADVAIFRSLADQLAIAIKQNELRQEVEHTLTELESAYGRYTRESWRAFIQALENTGFRYRQLSVEPINSESEEVRLAWERAETVLLHGREIGPGSKSTLAVPMKVRGEVVGVLNLQLDEENVPLDTANLIEEVAGRLGLVLENARLVEVSQRRLQRERLTTEISGRMRQYLDVDSVMKTAIEEIGKRLELSEVELRLRGPQAEEPARSNGHNGNGRKA